MSAGPDDRDQGFAVVLPRSGNFMDAARRARQQLAEKGVVIDAAETEEEQGEMSGDERICGFCGKACVEREALEVHLKRAEARIVDMETALRAILSGQLRRTVDAAIGELGKVKP